MTDKQPSKNLSLTNQSAWLLFGKVVGFGLSILLPLLTVRYLAQDKVGVYRQTFLVITNAVAILPLGFSMSAFYFLNRDPVRRPYTIFNILLFNFIAGGLACLGLFLYPQFLGNLFQSAEMTRLAPEIGVVIWLWVFSAFLEIVALANQETKLATAFIILAQFTKTSLMVGAVIFFSTVDAFLDAAIIQAVIQTSILVVYLKSRFPGFWKSFDPAVFRAQIFYALPFGLAGLLYTLQIDVHNYFVGYRFSEAEYAIYAIGCFELALVGMLYESISGVMIPRMSELESQGRRRDMFLMTVGAMKKLAFAYFPLFVFLMIVAEDFITTLFTKDYAASAPIFRINLLLLPLYCLILDPIARAFPEVGRFLLKVRIALFFVLLTSLWFGIRHFDLRGMIGIVVAVFLIEKIISLTKILKILDVRREDLHLLKTVGKTAISAIAAGMVLFVFYRLTHAALLQFCLSLGQQALSLMGFQKITELVGGSLFLGVCSAVYFSVYFLLANVLGALEETERERIKNLFGGRWSAVRNLFRTEPAKSGDGDAQKSIEPSQAADHRPLTTDHY